MYYVFIYVLILVSLDPISYIVWCARNSYKAFITTKIQRNNDQKKQKKKYRPKKKWSTTRFKIPRDWQFLFLDILWLNDESLKKLL